MNIEKFIILSVACTGGFITTAYQTIAQKRGWVIFTPFNLKKLGYVSLLGFLCQWGSVVISFIVNPWWSAFIVLAIGFISHMFIINILKKYAQIIAVIFLVSSYILIPIKVFGDNEKEVLSRNEIEALNHFKKSLECVNECARITNKGKPYESFSKEDIQKMMEYYEIALTEAIKVDINILNNMKNEFGDRFASDYMNGLKIVIAGHKEGNNEKLIRGQIYFEKWGEWYDNNIKKIRTGEK